MSSDHDGIPGSTPNIDHARLSFIVFGGLDEPRRGEGKRCDLFLQVSRRGRDWLLPAECLPSLLACGDAPLNAHKVKYDVKEGKKEGRNKSVPEEMLRNLLVRHRVCCDNH